MFRVFVVVLFMFLFISPVVLGAPVRVAQKAPAQGRESRQPALSILSIIPALGEPGGTVTLYGNGFTEGTTAFLGNTRIPTRVMGPKQLTFDIPSLRPGLYALYLQRKDGATSSIYNFNIMPLRPVLNSIQPDRIDACTTGASREVLLRGMNFQESSMVMFDGAAIPSRFISSDTLSFTVPNVSAGLHQVMVKNTEETQSTTRAIFIDTTPEITGISQGEERVNSYDLIVYGRNFQQDSSLSVDGTRIFGARAFAPPAGTEKVVVYSCTEMVYERYPYDTTPKSIRLQVINPNGETSEVVQITAP
jgi:hypothetical protein